MAYSGDQSIIYVGGTGVTAQNHPATYGDNMAQAYMEPNWTLESDTFGLVQSTVNYKQDLTSFLSTNGILNFPRGMTHPILSYLFLHKASASVEKGNIVNITANYCGIDPEMSDGYTIPIVSMVGSSSAEDITHHPNFIKKNCTSIAAGSVLAGSPPPAPYSFDSNSSTNPNRALWTPSAQNGALVTQPSFVAFLPPDNGTGINIKAGVRSYYKPQITLRLTMYVGGGSDSTADANAGKLASYNGWITKGSTFKLPEAYKQLAVDGAYPGNFTYSSDFAAYVNRSFLVTNVSMELFGKIYKVTADLMLSGINGWDKDIYPSIPGET
jgi:hypothetical protein